MKGLIGANRIYRLKESTSTLVNGKEVVVQWERTFKICYIGFYKGYHRVQLLTISLNHDSNVAKPHVYFQRRIASIFNVLNLSLTKEGNIAKIRNLIELCQRAKLVQEELSIDHQGWYIDTYFKELLMFLSNPEKAITYLELYSMFGLILHQVLCNKEEITTSVEYFRNDENAVIEQWAIGINDVLEVTSVENIIIEGGTYAGYDKYRKEVLEEVYLVFHKESSVTKYNLLWIG